MRILSGYNFLFVGTDRPCRLGVNCALFSGASGFECNRGVPDIVINIY
jgi:hypothetical protein